MPELKNKGCPLLLQSDTHPSLTMRGESHTRSYFLPCLERKCAAYKFENGSAKCLRFGTAVYYRTAEEENA